LTWSFPALFTMLVLVTVLNFIVPADRTTTFAKQTDV
jgi:hypothetical protein